MDKLRKIKVLIADDIKILRQGLQAVLSLDEEIEVVALAKDGKEAYDKTNVYEPDVVLMDMRMPDYDGAYGIKEIKKKHKEVKVLVLTTFDDEDTIKKAVESGADGYILKEMDDEIVISSVKNAFAGMSVFGDSIYKVMRENVQIQNETENNSDFIFTDRELDVIKLVGQGYDNKEIAAKLFLAEGTVRNQISRILEKTDLKDRTKLAIYAVKHGLD